MTPQERQLVDDLFDRLSQLESSPRDPAAEQVIYDGLDRAPNAVYALVQTVLVQDEALRRADERIRELTGEDQAPPSGGGFLDTMRNALGGRATSVPSVRSPAGPDPRWNSGGTAPNYYQQPASPYGAPQQTSGGGGSFLGTAAASAAGMIGGALLFNSIGSLFGGHHNSGSAFGNTGNTASPWDQASNAAGSDLSRDAGVNDIGSGFGGSDSQRAGLFDSDPNDADFSDAGDFGGDDVGGDFGGGDTA